MNENTNSIYCYKPDKLRIDTNTIFEVKSEGDKLRVQTDKLNILFNKLNKESFDKWYNDFRNYLSLDFSPVNLSDTTYSFANKEVTEIEQRIICHWLYHFTVNNYKTVLIRRDDFEHPGTTIEVYHYLNDQFGKDNEIVFKLGAHILRITIEAFAKTIDNYKQYIAMW